MLSTASSPLDLMPEPRPAYSRALLLPGPLPPLSHFGVTLLRHSVGSGLRYALYHLGLPVPETPPVEIIRLRLYIDAKALRTLLTHSPGGADVVAALLEPGGTGNRPAEARTLADTLSFHRNRLLPFRIPARRRVELRGNEAPEELWQRFLQRLDRVLVRTNDALLADLISSLDRRAARAQGEDVPPVLSRSAWKLRTQGKGNLRRFGLPDPMAPCWDEAPELCEGARHALARHPAPGHDRYRGRFREAWRAALCELAPIYRALAASAVYHQLLKEPEDAFFLSFESAANLARGQRSWLEAMDNRSEYEGARKAAEPFDILSDRQETSPMEGERPEWAWAPLLPLP
ncbi:MAG TPA: hypothetical protein VG477_02070 [Thermoanaerobaculia bacterium]|nr:hypothetical protein [Thermoanaerobaculia bacterium]